MTDLSFDDEIAALLALDALESGADAEPHAQEPPPALRAGTLARALSGRRPGRPIDAVPACDPAVSFDRTIADLADLLRALTGPEWDLPAHPDYGRVRDVVAHLLGVERLVLRWLDPDDTVPDLPDHVAATRSAVAEFAAADPREVARRWQETARAGALAAAAVPGRTVTFHDLDVGVDELLVMRTAELWAHAIDICRATGRPLPRLDMERMALLCDQLIAAVPLTLAYRAGSRPGRAARIVLTGPAGGTFTVPLSPGRQPADPTVTIVTDAVDLCLRAVRRLPPAELTAAIEGDQALGNLILTSIDALARD